MRKEEGKDGQIVFTKLALKKVMKRVNGKKNLVEKE